MNLQVLPNGSQICVEDPGEPSTGEKRISVTEREGLFLTYLARDRRVLEIGTGLGVSTRALAASAQSLTTLDPDPWVHTNIWPILSPRIRTTGLRGAVDGDFDLVFIDAEHTTAALTDDLAFAHAHCSRGLIVVHDAKIDEVRAALDDSYAYVDTHHGIAIRFVGWDA